MGRPVSVPVYGDGFPVVHNYPSDLEKRQKVLLNEVAQIQDKLKSLQGGSPW